MDAYLAGLGVSHSLLDVGEDPEQDPEQDPPRPALGSGDGESRGAWNQSAWNQSAGEFGQFLSPPERLRQAQSEKAI